jgi:hypothetical protein
MTARVSKALSRNIFASGQTYEDMVRLDVIGCLGSDRLPITSRHVFVREKCVTIIGHELNQHLRITRLDQLRFNQQDPHD